jgi:hypothetical protein
MPRPPVESYLPLEAAPESLQRWLAYNVETRTVTVTAVAGYRGINDGRNFNGYFRG